MSKRRKWLQICGALVALLVAYVVWATESPDSNALRARVPRWPNPQPTNDSAELLRSLSFEAHEDQTGSLNMLVLTYQGKPDEMAASAIELQQRREAASRVRLDRQLEVLLRLTQYEDVFSPPRENPMESFTLPNLSEAIRVLIANADSGLQRGDRGDLEKLIDVYAMLHRWRKNQWHTIDVIVGIAATAAIEDYFSTLVQTDNLLPAEAETIREVLLRRRPMKELAQIPFISEANRAMYLIDQLRSTYGSASFGRRQLARIIINPDLTEEMMLNYWVPIIEAIERDDTAEAQRLLTQGIEGVERHPLRHSRNWGGYAILRVVVPSMAVFGSKQEEQEKRLLDQVSAVAGSGD